MFSVKNGEIEHIVDNRAEHFFNDYIEIPDAFKSKANKQDEKTILSSTGYMLVLLTIYLQQVTQIHNTNCYPKHYLRKSLDLPNFICKIFLGGLKKFS